MKLHRWKKAERENEEFGKDHQKETPLIHNSVKEPSPKTNNSIGYGEQRTPLRQRTGKYDKEK